MEVFFYFAFIKIYSSGLNYYIIWQAIGSGIEMAQPCQFPNIKIYIGSLRETIFFCSLLALKIIYLHF